MRLVLLVRLQVLAGQGELRPLVRLYLPLVEGAGERVQLRVPKVVAQVVVPSQAV